MLTCKKVARSLADGDYADLPLRKRIGLRLHVLLCFVCGRYHRSVLLFQKAMRRYRQEEADREAPPSEEFCLREDEREALQRSLAEARAKSGSEDGETS